MGASHPWCKHQPTGEWWVILCYMACQEGHSDGVRFLVECGNVNQADDGGRSPLFIACHKGHIYVISTLLEGGANVKHRDENGATAFCLSCQAAHFAIDCHFEMLDVVQLMLQQPGVNVSQLDEDVTTPIFMDS